MSTGQNEHGVAMKIKPQVAKVSKFLASIGETRKAGNRIVMDETDGYIQNKKTGAKTPMRLENNVFVFDLWVEKDEATAFPRQVRSIPYVRRKASMTLSAPVGCVKCENMKYAQRTRRKNYVKEAWEKIKRMK